MSYKNRYNHYKNTLNDLINGNLSDYKEAINDFETWQMIEFISFCGDYQYNINDLKLLNYLKSFDDDFTFNDDDTEQSNEQSEED